MPRFGFRLAQQVLPHWMGPGRGIFFFPSMHSSSNVTVLPQHIAIPMSNITNSTDGRPVLTFYAQLSSEAVVSSEVLMVAVEVRVHICCDLQLIYYCFGYRQQKISIEMPDFFQVA